MRPVCFSELRYSGCRFRLAAGRKPIDVILMFRMPVLQSLYNLPDEQGEYQVRDRLLFTQFLGLGKLGRFPAMSSAGCGLSALSWRRSRPMATSPNSATGRAPCWW
jgi:hypothetical protein